MSMIFNTISSQNSLPIDTNMEIQTFDNRKKDENNVFVELPEAPLDIMLCSESVEYNAEAQHVTRSKSTQKVRSEEVPFEFKASTSSDVIENPFRYSNS